MSEDDLVRAIEKLRSLGGGFGVVRIGPRQFVRSVPTELNTDTNAIIELAQVGVGGAVQALWVFFLGEGGLLGKARVLWLGSRDPMWLILLVLRHALLAWMPHDRACTGGL